MNVLAIDQGTSATKALVLGPDGVLGEGEVEVHPSASGDGAVEQDPGELWDSVVEAGRRAVAEAGAAIDAVGLANQGETVLAWDKGSGRPLAPAISWQDRRAEVVCERLRPHADELRVITGLSLDPYFSAPKITWLRENQTREGIATTTDAWLLDRLTGSYVTDAATASRTLLMDLRTGAWSERACELFKVDAATLPAIVDCAGNLGETDVFGRSVPVSGAVVDQQAALFAEGCLRAGEGKCTYGTGAFLLVNVGERAEPSRSGLVVCAAWRLEGALTYCLDGQVYTVGAAVNWLRKMGVLGEAADLDRLGSEGRPGNGVFVPALAGLAAPFWRPRARAAVTGLTLSTTRADLVRAIAEGIAAQVAWLGRAVESDLGAPLERLRVDGGLTRSKVLMQLQADLLQIPIEVYPSPNATAAGAAAFARLGAGGVDEAADAVGSWSPAATYEPSVSADEAEAALQRWRAAAEATMGLQA